MDTDGLRYRSPHRPTYVYSLHDMYEIIPHSQIVLQQRKLNLCTLKLHLLKWLKLPKIPEAHNILFHTYKVQLQNDQLV